MTEITCKMRKVWRVDGKNFLTLWGACLHKAKRRLLDEHAPRGRDGGRVWHYSLFSMNDGYDRIWPCTSYAESAEGFFDSERWLNLKLALAKHYFAEEKQKQKENGDGQ